MAPEGTGSTVLADIRPSSGDVRAREETRSAAVHALREGSDNVLLPLLIEKDREKYGSALQLSAEEKTALAAAIETARITEENLRTAVYETRIGDTAYTFMAVKEGGSWKLAVI